MEELVNDETTQQRRLLDKVLKVWLGSSLLLIVKCEKRELN